MKSIKTGSYFKLFMWLVLFTAMAFAQGGRYTRKSITYVDALLYTGSSDFLPESSEKAFLSVIHDGIKIERFDYNPLPASVQKKFINSAKEMKSMSDEEIGSVIEKTMLPELIKILDLEKEMRAQNLVDETQRNSFITTKAREMGITAQQIEQVMNSSYIYVPFISNYKEKKDKDQKEVSVTIDGGLIWYHVITVGEPGVKKIATLKTHASSSGEYKDKGYANAVKEAIKEISYVAAMNLEVKTRELSMFKLSAPIVDIERRTIRFPLNKAEGIKMDQPYFVGEYMENTNGKIKFHKDGFVRIGNVADPNKPGQQLSSAWAVHKGDWVPGMTIVEHPRLGLDIAFKPRMINMNIEEGKFYSDKGDHEFAVAFDDYSGDIFALDVSLNINIAPLTKKRQTFLVLGGTGSAVNVHNFIGTKEEISLLDLGFFEIVTTNTTIQENNWATYFTGYLGYMRKYYMGPLALHWEMVLGAHGLSASGKLDDEDISIINGSIGGRGTIGLEYAVNIDWNIGVFAGYTLFPSINYWYVQYDDDEEVISSFDDYNKPKISSIGPSIGFYIHFSPPSLPFSPGMILDK